jgi:hypothetical protein
VRIGVFLFLRETLIRMRTMMILMRRVTIIMQRKVKHAELD